MPPDRCLICNGDGRMYEYVRNNCSACSSHALQYIIGQVVEKNDDYTILGPFRCVCDEKPVKLGTRE